MRITEVTVTAKKHYCEIRRPTWLEIVYKIQDREALSDKEYTTWKQLEREILNIANQKANSLKGIVQSDCENVRFNSMGCTFIIKTSGNIGKIINIQRE